MLRIKFTSAPECKVDTADRSGGSSTASRSPSPHPDLLALPAPEVLGGVQFRLSTSDPAQPTHFTDRNELRELKKKAQLDMQRVTKRPRLKQKGKLLVCIH